MDALTGFMKFKWTLLLSTLLCLGCGGGSGQDEEQIPPESSVQQPPVADEAVNIIGRIRLADQAHELDPKLFGFTAWQPKAMAMQGDILYIANLQPSVQILRYDLKQQRALSPIQVDIPNHLKPRLMWQDLTDLYIEDQIMYVATGAQQRVDILSFDDQNAKLHLSLGTGALTGGQPFYALSYPTAVTASRDYIFVADQSNRINVWQKNSLSTSEDLVTRKFARLNLPQCGAQCVARLEVVGPYLYATTPSGQSYKYAIDQIVAATDTQTLIQPQKSQNLAATALFYAQAEDLLYSAAPNGMLQSFQREVLFNSQQVLADRSQSHDQISTVVVQGQTQPLNNSQDLVVHDSTIYRLAGQKIYALPLHDVVYRQFKEQLSTQQLLEQNAIQHTRLLQDQEPWETLTNVEQRHVYMNKILSVAFKDQGLQLQSYSAVPVRDLYIHAKLRGRDEWVELAKLDQLSAFSQTMLDLNLKQKQWNVVDGTGSIALDGLEKFKIVPHDIFEQLRIYSPTDLHVQKLNQIQAKWKIYFGRYDEPQKWCRISPVYAREWVIMMTNLAYLLSSPEFKTLWFNHKAVMGHDFFGNAGQVEAANGYFKAQDYARVYQEILDRDEVNLGVTNMGGGLGGWSVLGVDTWLFYGHYRLSGMRIIAHEFGHRWGGHSSAWAMQNHGFEAMVDWLNFYFQRRAGSLPYMDPNVNAFHLTPDSELCQGVNQTMVKGVAKNAPWNKVDEYFKHHPVQ